MCGAIPPLPLHVFMAWCLFKHRDFTLLYFNEMEMMWEDEVVVYLKIPS
jgi:hypothetical protein